MDDAYILAYSSFIYCYLQRYRPIRIVDRIALGDHFANLDYIVIQYMAKYGIENIRGGSYIDMNITSQYPRIQSMIDTIYTWIIPEDPLYDYFQERRKNDRALEIFRNELRIHNTPKHAKDEEMYYSLTRDSLGDEIFWNDYLYDITPAFIADSENTVILDLLKEKYSHVCHIESICDADADADADAYKTMLYTVINHIDQYAFHLSTYVYEEDIEKVAPIGCAGRI